MPRVYMSAKLRQSLPRTERWSLTTLLSSPPMYWAGICTRGSNRLTAFFKAVFIITRLPRPVGGPGLVIMAEVAGDVSRIRKGPGPGVRAPIREVRLLFSSPLGGSGESRHRGQHPGPPSPPFGDGGPGPSRHRSHRLLTAESAICASEALLDRGTGRKRGSMTIRSFPAKWWRTVGHLPAPAWGGAGRRRRRAETPTSLL